MRQERAARRLRKVALGLVLAIERVIGHLIRPCEV